MKASWESKTLDEWAMERKEVGRIMALVEVEVAMHLAQAYCGRRQIKGLEHPDGWP